MEQALALSETTTSCKLIFFRNTEQNAFSIWPARSEGPDPWPADSEACFDFKGPLP